MTMRRFLSYIEEIGKQKKLTKTQLSLAIAGIVLFLAIALTLPNYLIKRQQVDTSHAAGTTYYVDSVGGSDSNAGTSTGAPWQSLNKVNAQTFAPGDVINFKRGGVWTGTLAVDSNGTASAPVTYQAYATGAAPIIQTASTHQTGGYTNVIDVTGDYNIIQDFLLRNAHQTAIYLYIGADHNTVQNNEMTQNGYGVLIKSSFNLVTQNYVHDTAMVVNDTSNPDNDYGGTGFWFHGTSSNNEISYNQCVRCKAPSFDYGYDGGMVEFWGNGQTITNVNIHHNYAEDTMGFSETGGGGTISNVTWSYNVINNIPEGSFCFHDGGTFAVNHVNFRIENNTIYKNVAGGGRTLNCMGSATWLTVRNNIFYTNIQMAPVGNFTHTNNLYYMTGGASIGYTLDSSEKMGDPLFVTAKEFQIHILRV